MISEALPIMQRVTHELNQSCHLGILEGDRVVIVAQGDSPLSVGFYLKVGGVGTALVPTQRRPSSARFRPAPEQKGAWI
jgi:DNA-binding IclR family transcriptional regulator